METASYKVVRIAVHFRPLSSEMSFPLSITASVLGRTSVTVT
jgi:hypothetical protein